MASNQDRLLKQASDAHAAARRVFDRLEEGVSIKSDAREGKHHGKHRSRAIVLWAVTIGALGAVLAHDFDVVSISPWMAGVRRVAALSLMFALVATFRVWQTKSIGPQQRLRVLLYQRRERFRRAHKAIVQANLADETIEKAALDIAQKKDRPDGLADDIRLQGTRLEHIVSRLPAGSNHRDFLEDGKTLLWLSVAASLAIMLSVAALLLAVIATLYAFYFGERGPFSIAPAELEVGWFCVAVLLILALPLVAFASWKRAFRVEGRDAQEYARERAKYDRLLNRLARYSQADADTEREDREGRLLQHQGRFDEGRPNVGALIEALKRVARDEESRAGTQLAFGLIIGILALTMLFWSIATAQEDMAVYLDRRNCLIAAGPSCPPVASGAVLQASQGQLDALTKSAETNFWLTITGKGALILLSNAFAFFFLFGFRRHMADAKYYRNELATFQARLRALSEAEELLKQAKSDPERASALASLARIHQRLAAMDRNPALAPGSSTSLVEELKIVQAEFQTVLGSLRAAAASTP